MEFPRPENTCPFPDGHRPHFDAVNRNRGISNELGPQSYTAQKLRLALGSTFGSFHHDSPSIQNRTFE